MLHLAFYYPEFGGSRNYEDIWHSLSIRLVLGDMLRVVYSVAALHFSEAKLISLVNTGAVASFSFSKSNYPEDSVADRVHSCLSL